MSPSVVAPWLSLTRRAAPILEAAPDPIAILIGRLRGLFDARPKRLGRLELLGLLQGFLCHVFVLPLNLPLWGDADMHARLAPLSPAILGEG